MFDREPGEHRCGVVRSGEVEGVAVRVVAVCSDDTVDEFASGFYDVGDNSGHHLPPRTDDGDVLPVLVVERCFDIEPCVGTDPEQHAQVAAVDEACQNLDVRAVHVDAARVAVGDMSPACMVEPDGMHHLQGRTGTDAVYMHATWDLDDVHRFLGGALLEALPAGDLLDHLVERWRPAPEMLRAEVSPKALARIAVFDRQYAFDVEASHTTDPARVAFFETQAPAALATNPHLDRVVRDRLITAVDTSGDPALIVALASRNDLLEVLAVAPTLLGMIDPSDAAAVDKVAGAVAQLDDGAVNRLAALVGDTASREVLAAAVHAAIRLHPPRLFDVSQHLEVVIKHAAFPVHSAELLRENSPRDDWSKFTSWRLDTAETPTDGHFCNHRVLAELASLAGLAPTEAAEAATIAASVAYLLARTPSEWSQIPGRMLCEAIEHSAELRTALATDAQYCPPVVLEALTRFAHTHHAVATIPLETFTAEQLASVVFHKMLDPIQHAVAVNRLLACDDHRIRSFAEKAVRQLPTAARTAVLDDLDAERFKNIVHAYGNTASRAQHVDPSWYPLLLVVERALPVQYWSRPAQRYVAAHIAATCTGVDAFWTLTPILLGQTMPIRRAISVANRLGRARPDRTRSVAVNGYSVACGVGTVHRTVTVEAVDNAMQ